jgi:hypothetical protein
MERMTVRFSAIQHNQLKKLAEKLQIDVVSVLRLAITRLAELEGVAPRPKYPRD